MRQKVITPLKKFLQLESAGGLILIAVTGVAMIWANSLARDSYHGLVTLPLLGHSLQHWVNDGLMVIFFFVVGMEIKCELLSGELSSPKRAALPLMGALGGMLAPALIYCYFNYGGPAANGWAVPMATDIAFAVGVMSLMSKRVPFALKVFLLALAIIDDLGAVLVIAFFYTEKIYLQGLVGAVAIVAAIFLLRRLKMQIPFVYLILGVLLWTCILKSGVHATIAGVLLGFLTSVTAAKKLISQLHPYVSYLIMPTFALVNAGVYLGGVSFSQVVQAPVAQGVSLGLMIGKPAGIFLLSWLSVQLGWAQLPRGVTWWHLLCAGMLGGIGFTMALFVANLGLKIPELEMESKLGILLGSLASALLGILFLYLAPVSRNERTS